MEDGTLVALKTVKSGFKPNDPESIKREINILEKLPDHRNIITLFHHFNIKGGIALLMEFAELGHLQTFMESQRPELLSCFGLFLDMAKGVEHLQNHKIIHRDLKPDNVLMFARNNYAFCKIADFGTARYLEKLGHQSLTMKPCQWYGAPELPNRYYSESVDVYSLGAIYFAVTVLKRKERMAPMAGNQVLLNIVMRSETKAILAEKLVPYFKKYCELVHLVSSMIVDEYYGEKRIPVSKVVDKLADHCEELRNRNIVIRPVSQECNPRSSYGNSTSGYGGSGMTKSTDSFTVNTTSKTPTQDSTTGSSGYSSTQTGGSTDNRTSGTGHTFNSTSSSYRTTGHTFNSTSSSYKTARSDITSDKAPQVAGPHGANNANTSDDYTSFSESISSSKATTPESEKSGTLPITGSSGRSNVAVSKNATNAEKETSNKPTGNQLSSKKSGICIVS